MKFAPNCLKLLAAAAALALAASTASADQTKPLNSNDKIQIDARGPIHEAFAKPYQAGAAPNESVEKKPPDPIPEEPAPEKPKGKNVQWIPGYWQWDSDRKDFIWVSGIWRDMPEGRRWIMGYWANTPEGNRWVSGHFAAAQEKDNQYVPEPPENKDQGPTTKPPDDNSMYIPGNWFYTDTGYNYRDGYWTEYRPDQVWEPARYTWTPNGYVFSNGYWDYPLTNRGMLFAPAYFTAPLWQTSGWSYQPTYPVATTALYNALFVGLGLSHYYFGDYYGSSYLNYGITPWYWYSSRWYDPIWTYDRWANRQNPQWASSFQTTYDARVNATAALPPRTLATQTAAAATAPRMITTLAQVRQSGQPLIAVTPQQQAASRQAARQMISQSLQLSQSAARPSVSTSNRVNVGAAAGAPRSAAPAPTAPHPATPAPHIPTGNLQNMHQPAFPPPHPGGFPGGHGKGGGGGDGKPPKK